MTIGAELTRGIDPPIPAQRSFGLAAVLLLGLLGAASLVSAALAGEAFGAPAGLVSAALVGEASGASAGLDIRAGDVVFQRLSTPQTDALAKATGSVWTHCGLVADRRGRLVVQEALLRMAETPLELWIARGGGEVVVLRLKDDTVLSQKALAAMTERFESLRDRRYDILFRWSDEAIYCSELVHKIFERALGIVLVPLRRVGDFDLSDPVVAKLIAERFPEGLDLDEPAVAPADLLESPLLHRVMETTAAAPPAPPPTPIVP